MRGSWRRHWTLDAGDLGEFGLIARLRTRLAPANARLVVGPGDDAAVWRAGDGYVIATTDTLVAGVHFLPGRVPWSDVGWKSLAANISDIAAMGGRPEFALVTLCLPKGTTVETVDALYDGVIECASEHDVTVAGGDIVAAEELVVTVALLGAAEERDGQPLLLRRSNARPGDIVAVTGPLGGSAGGVRVLRAGGPSSDEERMLVRRQMRPRPRVDAGTAAVRAGVRCGIDISDGLAQDLGHICEESGVGAELRLADVPVDPALTAVFPDDARVLAATGGEDYELIIVGPADTIAATERALGGSLAVIGRITEGDRVRVLDEAGAEVALTSPGWDHLRGRA